MPPKIPRFYQREADESAMFALSEYDRILLRLGTGAGKTLIAAFMIAKLLPSRCLFLGDSDELCSQPLRVITNVAGVIPALEKSNSRASLDARCVVGSSQTMARKERLARFPTTHFDYIFVDECHRGSDRDALICGYFSGAKVIGITATPFRADMADLSKWFEYIAYEMPMVDMANPLKGLIGQGFAPPWRVKSLAVNIDLENLGVVRTPDGREYKASELDDRIEPHYHEIAELYKEHAPGRHGIAFLVLKASSEKFAAICREHGIKAIHIAGDSPDRDEIIERARRGEYDLICNAQVLGTGIDIPILDCFLNLRPTRSLAAYQQNAGRVCRVLEGLIDDLPEEDQAEERKARIAASSKPNSLVLDLLWQRDMLGTAHPGHLVAASEDEANAINEKTASYKSEHDLFATAHRVLIAREKALKEALERAAASAKKKLVPAEHIGFLIADQHLQDYQPQAMWEMEPPTEAQISWLTEKGIDCENLESKGLARKIMDALTFRAKYGMATPKILRLMKRLHMDQDRDGIAAVRNPERLTIKAAGRMIQAEYDRRKRLPRGKKGDGQGFLL